MKSRKWLWITVLSLFIVSTGITSFCFAQEDDDGEDPVQSRTLRLSNGMRLKQVWHLVGKDGKSRVASGNFRLKNGKVLKLSRGVVLKKGTKTRPSAPKKRTRQMRMN